MNIIKKIKVYVEKRYARKFSIEEAEKRTKKTFYLQHFGVKTPNKSKLRLVFNAAAEINSFSLNKALIPGPDLNQPLLTILFKFREAPVAVCGDIKEMFHQILIRKEDLDSQRFLWRGGDMSKPVETYVMERMIFGATCSPTVAQYVKNLNAMQYENEHPRAVKGITERHYVDDYVDCFETTQEAMDTLHHVIKIHQFAGFHLTNIISNSPQINRLYGNYTGNYDCGNLMDGGNSRILGMNWQPQSDHFCFVFKFVNIKEKILKFLEIPTKRQVLSVVMSVFDPFGFVANFMVTGKILVQKTWKAGIQWDDALPENLFNRWKMWMQEIVVVEQFRVPRCYKVGTAPNTVDLHVFVDASEEAMAVVAYWRAKNGTVVFVSGKSSCAPTRFHSIPKLELQAAVMGVRMKKAIVENHNIFVNNFIFWTDSHTVVQWIRSDHRNYKQYVANRVAEILDGSDIKDWRWCPGIHNPADEATRSKFPPNYDPEGRWKIGPAFLQLDEENWPTEDLMHSTKDDSSSELRSKRVFHVQVCALQPNFYRFSNLSRMKRSVAWVFRYVGNLKRKIDKEAVISGELTAQEEEKSLKFLCRLVQEERYGPEIDALSEGSVFSGSNELRTLNPILGVDGLLRVGGRISKASCLSLETRHPIILPTSHHFTNLVCQHYHRKMAHINVSTVMSEVRQLFWVPSLRRLLNSIQAKCATCRLRRAKPMQPQMGLLPKDRLTPYVRPFSYTGIDLFGPVTVTIRRQKEKRWVALFTCLTIRAVHLEIVADLSTDACLVAIRNFINRRGVPVVMRSDNGTNFVGIPKELKGCNDFLDNNDLISGLSPLGIRWKFNTPSNPSEGGVWERLVQSVKKALYAVLREHSPRLETLHSVLIEAENMVNSRPLTHLAVTPEDPEPLTPNHFLLGCCNSTQTPAAFEPRLMCLRKQWKIAQNLKNGLWHQWVREYLPELTRRTKWCTPSTPLTTGSIVLICETDAPRSQWKRGRIISLRFGADKVARSAEVSTSSGIYKRPVSKLALLECEASP